MWRGEEGKLSLACWRSVVMDAAVVTSRCILHVHFTSRCVLCFNWRDFKHNPAGSGHLHLQQHCCPSTMQILQILATPSTGCSTNTSPPPHRIGAVQHAAFQCCSPCAPHASSASPSRPAAPSPRMALSKRSRRKQLPPLRVGLIFSLRDWLVRLPCVIDPGETRLFCFPLSLRPRRGD